MPICRSNFVFFNLFFCPTTKKKTFFICVFPYLIIAYKLFFCAVIVKLLWLVEVKVDSLDNNNTEDLNSNHNNKKIDIQSKINKD